MGPGQARSRFRDDDEWDTRLVANKEAIKERIGEDRMLALGAFLTLLDGMGMADFLVVYGKAARLGIEATKDTDFYFEAAWIPGVRAPLQVEDEHEGMAFHAYGWPTGALLQNLRGGDGFAFGLVRDALIFVDRGLFREALVAVDEEGLTLAEGESMDKPQDPAVEA